MTYRIMLLVELTRLNETDDGNSGDGAGRLLCGAGDAVPVQGGGAGRRDGAA